MLRFVVLTEIFVQTVLCIQTCGRSNGMSIKQANTAVESCIFKAWKKIRGDFLIEAVFIRKIRGTYEIQNLVWEFRLQKISVNVATIKSLSVCLKRCPNHRDLCFSAWGRVEG